MTYSESANLALNQTLVRSHQHLDHRAAPGDRDPRGRGGLPRCRHAQGPGPGAVHRYRRRHVLLDLHRNASAGSAQGARPADEGARQAGRGEAFSGRTGGHRASPPTPGRPAGRPPRQSSRSWTSTSILTTSRPRRPRRRRARPQAPATSPSARAPETVLGGRSVGDPPGRRRGDAPRADPRRPGLADPGGGVQGHRPPAG